MKTMTAVALLVTALGITSNAQQVAYLAGGHNFIDDQWFTIVGTNVEVIRDFDTTTLEYTGEVMILRGGIMYQQTFSFEADVQGILLQTAYNRQIYRWLSFGVAGGEVLVARDFKNENWTFYAIEITITRWELALTVGLAFIDKGTPPGEELLINSAELVPVTEDRQGWGIYAGLGLR